MDSINSKSSPNQMRILMKWMREGSLSLGSTRKPPQKTTQDKSALEIMEVVFNGNYSLPKIKEQVDKAMQLYGLELTEDNYNRVASVLVKLRQEYSVDEMDILNYMICSHINGVSMTFPDMAAISVVALTSGDRCR